MSTKRDFVTMTAEELIKELKHRDARIETLERECKKLKASAANSIPTSAGKVISPEKVKESADKLKKLVIRGVKSQMKWKPSCKRGSARFSWGSLCDEDTFRAFMDIPQNQKAKGKKFTADEFQDFLGTDLTSSIRYGYLYLRGNANVTYTKDGEIKVTGGYGL